MPNDPSNPVAPADPGAPPFPCGGHHQPACPPEPAGLFSRIDPLAGAIIQSGPAYSEEQMRAYGWACYQSGFRLCAERVAEGMGSVPSPENG